MTRDLPFEVLHCVAAVFNNEPALKQILRVENKRIMPSIIGIMEVNLYHMYTWSKECIVVTDHWIYNQQWNMEYTAYKLHEARRPLQKIHSTK